MSIITAKQDALNTTITIGGSPFVVLNSNPKAQEAMKLAREYNNTRDVERREEIRTKLLEAVKSPYRQTIDNDERFEIDTKGRIYLSGVSQPIPHALSNMVKSYIDNKLDVTPLANFWLLLSRNPDPNVQEQLFSFLKHNGHPITDHGYFVAYKAVDFTGKYDTETGKLKVTYDADTGTPVDHEDPTSSMVFQPFHRGPHGSVIKCGTPVSMPREECDSDPNATCSSGLHVGSMAYVGDFGHNNRVVLECLVNPRNVVAVPNDYNNTKMRVCEYYPLSVATGENPDIYLASDYKNYETGEIQKELESRRKAREEVIAEIVARDEEHEAILNSLY